MFNMDVLTQLGINPASAGKFGGALALVLAAIFGIVKYRVIRLIAVDQATELIRTRWGEAKPHLFGARKGRIVRLKAGRHLLVRGIYDGWQVPLNEIVSVLNNKGMLLAGYSYTIDTLTIGYRVLATDDEAGDEAMQRYVLSVQQPERDNQISEGLRQKVEAIVMSKLPDAIAEGSPRFTLLFDEVALKALVAEELFEHGVALTRVFMTSPAVMNSTAILEFARHDTSVHGIPALMSIADDVA